MKRLIFLFVLCTYSSSAQTIIDSLRQLIPKNKYEQAQVFHQIGFHQEFPDSNIFYQRNALSILKGGKDSLIYDCYTQLAIANILKSEWVSAESFLDSSEQYVTYTRLPHINSVHSTSLRGVIAERQGKIKKALSYYSTGISKLRKSDLQTREGSQAKANLLANRGGLYHKQGAFEKAVDDYVSALRIRRALGEINEELIILNNIGGVYLDSEEYEQSNRYYSEMHSVAKKHGLEFLDMYALVGIASALLKSDEWEKSRFYLHKAEDLSEKFGDGYCLGIVYGGLSSIYLKDRNFENAQDYALKSIEVSRQILDPHLEAESFNKLGEVYIELKRYPLAIRYIDSSLFISTTQGYDKTRLTSFRLLSRGYAGDRKFESAFYQLEKYMGLKDSLSGIENKKNIEEILTKYEVEQKNNKILSQDLEIEKQGRRNTHLILLFVVFGVLVIAISVFVYLRIRLRAKERLRNQQEERKRYEEEVSRIKSLNEILEQKISEQDNTFEDDRDQFHQILQSKYELSDAQFEYWILQAQGISEKEMADMLHRTLSSIQSRRKLLLSKLKQFEPDDEKTLLSSRSVAIYYENRLKYVFSKGKL